MKQEYYCFHFIDEETEALKRLNNLPRMTHCGEAWVCLLESLTFELLRHLLPIAEKFKGSIQLSYQTNFLRKIGKLAFRNPPRVSVTDYHGELTQGLALRLAGSKT